MTFNLIEKTLVVDHYYNCAEAYLSGLNGFERVGYSDNKSIVSESCFGDVVLAEFEKACETLGIPRQDKLYSAIGEGRVLFFKDQASYQKHKEGDLSKLYCYQDPFMYPNTVKRFAFMLGVDNASVADAANHYVRQLVADSKIINPSIACSFSHGDIDKSLVVYSVDGFTEY